MVPCCGCGRSTFLFLLLWTIYILGLSGVHVVCSKYVQHTLHVAIRNASMRSLCRL